MSSPSLKESMTCMLVLGDISISISRYFANIERYFLEISIIAIFFRFEIEFTFIFLPTESKSSKKIVASPNDAKSKVLVSSKVRSLIKCFFF